MSRARIMKICAVVTTLACIPLAGLTAIYMVSRWFGYGPSALGRNIFVISLLVPTGCFISWAFLAWATYKPDKP